ncbi:hypothetical protein ARMA_3065 [Ardenticatena maritima]|uniref:DUF3179 domain-containing protein n=1 Tax=Ardenticatena maritima TaxID=872965 RepID=A0A0M8KBI3_9CHLR|nr:DUF3179 domain-containing (seleno)protein [Ardenticatena maritima]GAP64642.1 hypothetical protein ARMA_3065 [Ardenticatena maritima]
MRQTLLSLVFILLTLAACGERPAASPPAPPPIPTLDTSRAAVPLDEIVFDLLHPINQRIPLSQASPELRAAAFDAVPPLYEDDLAFESHDAAHWLADDDIVIGYANAAGAWAFPLRILNYHELINATLGGEAVLVSYCPLCYSGAVFSRRLPDGRVLTFGNSGALYANDAVMVDHETGSYWYHIAGEAIVGPLTGTQLDLLPSNTLTWREWRAQHPQTYVLARPAFDRPYDFDPFLGLADLVRLHNNALPLERTPQGVRMPTAQPVLVLNLGDQWRAYPLPRSETPLVWQDSFAEHTVAVFITQQAGAPVARAYDTRLDGRTLTFEVDGDAWRDRETGSRWTFEGRATEGDLAGRTLRLLSERTTHWFVAVASVPTIQVFVPENE